MSATHIVRVWRGRNLIEMYTYTSRKTAELVEKRLRHAYSLLTEGMEEGLDIAEPFKVTRQEK